MSKFILGLHVFVLRAIFLAHHSQGYRFQPTNQLDMDRKSHSSGDAWSSMQALYGAALPSGDGGGTPTLFAVHKTEDNDKGYYGFMATMDVYGYNLNGGQMSSAAIWINNDEGDWKQDLDAITVGWLVFPSHFKDSQTHLFTHWTRDDGRSTGCLNMDCPGFQLASGSTVTPGDIIKPVSDVNGVHQNITIKLFKDKSSGDWLLHYGFNSAPAVVGHFPASLFDSLSKKATDIMFGGHVRYAKGVSSPAMGSGAFPSDKAASFWDLQLIDEDGNSIPIQNDLPSLVTDKSSYSISPIEGAKFSYGGPGGKSA